MDTYPERRNNSITLLNVSLEADIAAWTPSWQLSTWSIVILTQPNSDDMACKVRILYDTVTSWLSWERGTCSPSIETRRK